MKILVVSDFHADMYTQYAKPISGKPWNSRFQNQLDTLEQAFSVATDAKADMVFNGDLYNQRKSIDSVVFNEVSRVIAIGCHKVYEYGGKVYFLAGNHDQYDNSPVPANSIQYLGLLGDNIEVIMDVGAAPVRNSDDTQMVFMPYSEDTDMLKELLDSGVKVLKDTGQKAYLFAHIGVSGAQQGRWNHRLGGAFNVNELHPDYFQQIVLGHYHLRQELQDNVYYVGNTVPLNHNDDGQQKGFVMIDTDTNSHEFIPVDNPMFYTIDTETTKLSADEISKLSKQNFVKVIAHSKESVDTLKDGGADDNLTVSYIAEQKDESRLGLSADASDAQIVKAYTEKYHPDVVKTSLDILNKAAGQN